MIYTAGNPHTAGYGQLPEDAHATSLPAVATPHDTHYANNNRMVGRQMSCRQQTLCPVQMSSARLAKTTGPTGTDEGA
jgi:hypothetical protein